MALVNRPQGTFDQLPEGSPKIEAHTRARAQRYVTDVAGAMLERAGAQLIVTPLFEEAEVVRRGVGGSTDIVRKEMFSVFYQGEHGGYVLRPEGTAPIVRAYLQNGLKQLPSPLRLWTHGPMFRAERQQQGRYRQFHQVDYEVLGSEDPVVDAEAIALMVDVYARLGVRGTRVKLGSVGDPEDREAYNAYLRDLFEPHVARLSDDSKDRLTRNPMRILDSKSEGDQALIAELRPEALLDRLGVEARAHFDAVRGFLDAWGVPYDVDPGIVRGLDYYRRTAWEVHHEHIGAKSALGGGGRYDGLAEMLGGPRTPAVGWAFGVERVLLAMHQEGVEVPDGERPLLYVAALDEQFVALAARLAFTARANGVAEYAITPRKPGKAIGEALKKGARYVAFIGSDEAARGYVSIKDLDTGTQMPVPVEALDDILARRLSLRSGNIADIVLELLLTDTTVLNGARLAQTVVSDAEVTRFARAFTNKAFLQGLTLPGAARAPEPFAGLTPGRSKSAVTLWNFLDPTL